MTSFDETVLSYDENKTSLGFFGRVILIFEGKINSTDGAKSEHCYALCSRIRLILGLKIWNLNVQIIIAAWNSDFKIHCQIIGIPNSIVWAYFWSMAKAVLWFKFATCNSTLKRNFFSSVTANDSMQFYVFRCKSRTLKW